MSDFYNKYPYTDFHELNLDWIIERVKQLTADWLETKQAWENTEADWQELYDYVHDYFDNLDVQEEINNKINAMIADGTFVTITTPVIEAKVASMMPGTVASQIGDTVASQIGATVASQIGGTVASQIDDAVVSPVNTWLAANITQPTTPVVDTSLTISGAAADAAVTGKKISKMHDALSVMNNGGNLDFYWGNAVFYNGYYNSLTYQGDGNPATPPFTGVYTVLLVHVIEGVDITISGFGSTGGSQSVWLNSNSLNDVYDLAWSSANNNGTHTCKTEWLALSGYETDPDTVSIKYEMRNDLIDYTDAVDNKMLSFKNNTFSYQTQYLDVNDKIDQSFYYSNSRGIGSSPDLCCFPPIQVTAGQMYTIVNCRTRFCNFETGGVVTCLDISDAGTTDKTIAYTPASNGLLYVSGNRLKNVMVFKGSYVQSDYVYGDFNYAIKTAALGESVTEDNCTFFKKCYQMLKVDEFKQHGYYGVGSGNAIYIAPSNDISVYNPIPVKANETYHFTKVYGYFTIFKSNDNLIAEKVTSSTTKNYNGNYTPLKDGHFYVSVDDSYVGSAMICNDTKYLPDTYTEGLYYTYFDGDIGIQELNITVKQDGTGDYTSVVDAVAHANVQSGSYPINIYVYSGDYNILTELGGQDFIDTISSNPDERQGLRLERDNVNLIGVGYVILRFEMPDTVTYTESSHVSCLNLLDHTNSVENMTLIAKNCRYVIHDETNGGNPHIHRVMKNLRCIHKGNLSTLWQSMCPLGGGAGGGSTYDLINCQFLTTSFYVACSYHTNTNEECSFFNFDGCVGSVNNSSGKSFRVSYHGTGRTGLCVANVKNCSGNGTVVVEPEVSGDTDNNIELYVNGWETIAAIPVTGNE